MVSQMERYEVIVSLKEGVVDPEGDNTRKALNLLGFASVTGVRYSRRYIIEVEGTGNESDVEEMCRRLLANPAIQKYAIKKAGND
ncbi:MAG: phosphoribosylformylglycinamidine synthase subunit PurS [Methanomassiliicoccales archaeon]